MHDTVLGHSPPPQIRPPPAPGGPATVARGRGGAPLSFPRTHRVKATHWLCCSQMALAERSEGKRGLTGRDVNFQAAPSRKLKCLCPKGGGHGTESKCKTRRWKVLLQNDMKPTASQTTPSRRTRRIQVALLSHGSDQSIRLEFCFQNKGEKLLI